MKNIGYPDFIKLFKVLFNSIILSIKDTNLFVIISLFPFYSSNNAFESYIWYIFSISQPVNASKIQKFLGLSLLILQHNLLILLMVCSGKIFHILNIWLFMFTVVLPSVFIFDLELGSLFIVSSRTKEYCSLILFCVFPIFSYIFLIWLYSCDFYASISFFSLTYFFPILSSFIHYLFFPIILFLFYPKHPILFSLFKNLLLILKQFASFCK